VSQAGSSEFGRLSVLGQWRTHPKILFDVDRHAFTPSPSVTSTLLRIEPLAEPRAPARLGDLERITTAAFGQRRKMLRQSLKRLAPDAENLIRSAGVDPVSRPQDLDIEQFAALSRSFSHASPRSGDE
jgi:16S rRNA (adenine1518-N6/adenine1519-N6)-dimethyltransferase